MMECPHCKKMVPDDSHFCLFCMNRLNENEIVVIAPAAVKKKAKWVLPTSLALLLCLVGVGCFYLFSPKTPTVPASNFNSIPDQSEKISNFGFVIVDNLLRRVTGNGTVLEIPDVVTTIGEQAMNGMGDIQTVKIPESVTKIGYSAFYMCRSLQSFHVSKNIKEIEDQVFGFCQSLEAITCDEDHPYFKSVDGVLYSKDGTQLLVYPAGKRDTEFVIPDTVTRITQWAFEGNPYLTKVTVPASVTDIFCPFGYCTALKEVVISPDNPYFSATDGVMYNKDGTRLMLYPPAKGGTTTFKIPPQVREIEVNAFTANKILTSVTVPEGVTLLDTFVFKECEKLTTVNYPSTLEVIAEWAFFQTGPPLLLQGPENEIVIKFAEQNKYDYKFVE